MKLTAIQLQARRNRQAIKRMVLKAGCTGVRMNAIMSTLQLSETTVGDTLRRLAAEGIIERSHNAGPTCVWGAPGTWARYEAARQRAAAQRAHRRDRGELGRAERLAAEQFADSPPVRRWVSANDAPPVQTRAVASVWGLAA